MTAEDEKARLEYRVRRLEEEARALREHNAALGRLVASQERRQMELEKWLRKLDPSAKVTIHWPALEDGRGGVCTDHRAIQHRDGKPPWCHACGRTEEGQLVGVPAWQRRLAAEQSGDLCGAPAVGGPCVLPRGHNQGQPDIPTMHVAVKLRERD